MSDSPPKAKTLCGYFDVENIIEADETVELKEFYLIVNSDAFDGAVILRGAVRADHVPVPGRKHIAHDFEYNLERFLYDWFEGKGAVRGIGSQFGLSQVKPYFPPGGGTNSNKNFNKKCRKLLKEAGYPVTNSQTEVFSNFSYLLTDFNSSSQVYWLGGSDYYYMSAGEGASGIYYTMYTGNPTLFGAVNRPSKLDGDRSAGLCEVNRGIEKISWTHFCGQGIDFGKIKGHTNKVHSSSVYITTKELTEKIGRTILYKTEMWRRPETKVQDTIVATIGIDINEPLGPVYNLEELHKLGSSFEGCEDIFTAIKKARNVSQIWHYSIADEFEPLENYMTEETYEMLKNAYLHSVEDSIAEGTYLKDQDDKLPTEEARENSEATTAENTEADDEDSNMSEISVTESTTQMPMKLELPKPVPMDKTEDLIQTNDDSSEEESEPEPVKKRMKMDKVEEVEDNTTTQLVEKELSAEDMEKLMELAAPVKTPTVRVNTNIPNFNLLAHETVQVGTSYTSVDGGTPVEKGIFVPPMKRMEPLTGVGTSVASDKEQVILGYLKGFADSVGMNTRTAGRLSKLAELTHICEFLAQRCKRCGCSAYEVFSGVEAFPGFRTSESCERFKMDNSQFTAHVFPTVERFGLQVQMEVLFSHVGNQPKSAPNEGDKKRTFREAFSSSSEDSSSDDQEGV